jgi:hypothetical protein
MAEAVYLLCGKRVRCCHACVSSPGTPAAGAAVLRVVTLGNMLLFVDLIIIPDGVDLSIWRSIIALAGIGVLLFGLIWESR